MLPHVDHEQRDDPRGDVRLLVEELEDHEPAGDRVVGEHRPPRSLDAGRRRGEVRDEGVEGSEGVVDRPGQFARGPAAAVRGEIRPEDRVIGVPAQVEGEVLGELVDLGQVARLAGCGQILKRGVGARHVRGVVLVMVEPHDFRGYVGFQSRVVVGELWQGVGHVVPPFAAAGRRASGRWR